MTIFRPVLGGPDPADRRATQAADGPIVAQGAGMLNGKRAVVVVTDQTATVSDGFNTYSAPLAKTYARPTPGALLLVLTLGGKTFFIQQMKDSGQVFSIAEALNAARRTLP